MSLTLYEGVVDHGQIRLKADLHLPDQATVYIMVADEDDVAEAQVYDIRLPRPGPDGLLPSMHIYSPRLIPAGRGVDFTLEVGEGTD
jgi:hypothetical protein